MSGERAILKGKRRTRAEVQKLVEEFRRSGMRRIDFCRYRELSLSTLARHLRKSKKKDRGDNKPTIASDGLIRVEMGAVKGSPDTFDSGLAVVLSGGRRVEVKADFDVLTLQRLLAALESA
jgi:hypothetical protein